MFKNIKEKNGCRPSDVTKIYKHIQTECSHLKALGLMTIGSVEISLNKDESSDFQVIKIMNK